MYCLEVHVNFGYEIYRKSRYIDTLVIAFATRSRKCNKGSWFYIR